MADNSTQPAGVAGQANSRVETALSKVKREWIEGLFYFVLLITAAEAGFIIWDMITMYQPFARFINLKDANRITASADMSNLYLALLGVYAGFKEFRKWARLDDEQGVPLPGAEEKVEWFGRGTMIVFYWIGLAVVSTVMKDLHLINRLPEEVYRVALQSLAVWAGSSASSSMFRKQIKKAKWQVADTAPEPTESGNSRLGEEHRKLLLEYLKGNDVVDSEKCQEVTSLNRFQVHRLLQNMVDEGILTAEGSTKGRIYRKHEQPTTAKPQQ